MSTISNEKNADSPERHRLGDIESAMRFYGTHTGAQAIIRHTLSSIAYDD